MSFVEKQIVSGQTRVEPTCLSCLWPDRPEYGSVGESTTRTSGSVQVKPIRVGGIYVEVPRIFDLDLYFFPELRLKTTHSPHPDQEQDSLVGVHQSRRDG